jgi:hypothetical protein
MPLKYNTAPGICQDLSAKKPAPEPVQSSMIGNTQLKKNNVKKPHFVKMERLLPLKDSTIKNIPSRPRGKFYLKNNAGYLPQV